MGMIDECKLMTKKFHCHQLFYFETQLAKRMYKLQIKGLARVRCSKCVYKKTLFFAMNKCIIIIDKIIVCNQEIVYQNGGDANG